MTLKATPQLYVDIFETDRRGASILEDLIKRFSQPAVTEGGIDAVLKTYSRMGAQSVVQHIINQINRAQGVGDETSTTEIPE